MTMRSALCSEILFCSLPAKPLHEPTTIRELALLEPGKTFRESYYADSRMPPKKGTCVLSLILKCALR